VSSGPEQEWSEILGASDSKPTPLSQSQQVNERSTISLTPDLSFSATLCYSAFDTADISVTITSTETRNKTVPEPQFDFGTQRYTFGGVRNQYGQEMDHNHDISALEIRGIFQLVNQSWIAAPGIQPPEYSYIRQYANLAGPYNSDGNDPYCSGFMLAEPQETNINVSSSYYDQYPGLPNRIFKTLTPDPMHYWLFQDILSHGGSVAFALQSHLTTLASMVYYDQMAQFDNQASVSKSVFIETNLPRSFWGWLSVTIVLFIHIFLAWIIVFWFLVTTQYTMLGQDWQNVAHVTTDETKEFIAMAAQMSDDELKGKMKLAEAVKGQLGPSLSKS
jgi:hypothetical protein